MIRGTNHSSDVFYFLSHMAQYIENDRVKQVLIVRDESKSDLEIQHNGVTLGAGEQGDF